MIRYTSVLEIKRYKDEIVQQRYECKQASSGREHSERKKWATEGALKRFLRTAWPGLLLNPALLQ